MLLCGLNRGLAPAVAVRCGLLCSPRASHAGPLPSFAAAQALLYLNCKNNSFSGALAC